MKPMRYSEVLMFSSSPGTQQLLSQDCGIMSHLHDCAGEAVQDKAGAAFWRADVVRYEAHHNLIRHQRPRVHRLLSLWIIRAVFDKVLHHHPR